LSTGLGPDWCNPNITQYSYQLPGAGTPNDIVTASQGNAYIGTNGNSSGDTFGHVSVNYATASPTISYLGVRKPGYKTNEFAGDSNHAYLATTKGLVILNMSDLSDTNNTVILSQGVDSIFVAGSTGYMTAGSTFYVVNLSSITNPTISGQVGIAGTGMRIIVSGSTAYVATNDTNNQLQLINISNSSSPSIIRSISAGNSLAGQDVAINPSATRAYLITQYSSGKKNLFIIDPSNGNVISSYSTNGMNPNNVALASNNRVLIAGSGGDTYQVVDISTETDPSLCGHLATSYPFYGVAALQETNQNFYAYAITGDTDQFKVIQGGSGTSGFSTTGTFTSSIFDAGFNTAYNMYQMTYSTPLHTTLGLQLAVANPVGGSCNNSVYQFIGPDYTASSSYTASTSAIPLTTVGSYQNPGRCFRYKLNMSTTDITQTPVFYDITVNYSP